MYKDIFKIIKSYVRFLHLFYIFMIKNKKNKVHMQTLFQLLTLCYKHYNW